MLRREAVGLDDDLLDEIERAAFDFFWTEAGSSGQVKDRAFVHTDADRPLRHAVEPRHESFRDPAFAALLREHGTALVVADSAGTWPVFDEDLATTPRVTLVVQVNGKVRGRLDVERGTSELEALTLARCDERIVPWLEGRELARSVFVADRLLNLVVR